MYLFSGWQPAGYKREFSFVSLRLIIILNKLIHLIKIGKPANSRHSEQGSPYAASSLNIGTLTGKQNLLERMDLMVEFFSRHSLRQPDS